MVITPKIANLVIKHDDQGMVCIHVLPELKIIGQTGVKAINALFTPSPQVDGCYVMFPGKLHAYQKFESNYRRDLTME